ncbi:MAG: GntR family transcriptional regulator [Rubripirellula sp.]|nr:GntR family transcriptional regulator [Rubripirellula sp.]
MTITTYIKDDLTAQLKSGSTLPVQLTLDSLAAHYQVSLTPVRAAVSELIEEGWLEKGANRRLAATTRGREQGPPRKSKTKPKTPAPPRDPYEVVASDLVQLSLQGDAVYLREEATAENYSISRSAIRHILHRLAGEGVLDHIPRRGWRLRPFRQHDLQAFIEVREVLEIKALELARPKLDAEELQRMLERNVPDTSQRKAPVVDESLHEYLIATAGNTYIQDFFERQGRYYRMLFGWEDHDRAVALETMRQHREILTALLNKRWGQAKKALSRHIRDNHPILGKVAGDLGAGDLGAGESGAGESGTSGPRGRSRVGGVASNA